MSKGGKLQRDLWRMVHKTQNTSAPPSKAETLIALAAIVVIALILAKVFFSG